MKVSLNFHNFADKTLQDIVKSRKLFFWFLLQKKKHELWSKLALLSRRITLIWGTFQCFQMCTLNFKGEKSTQKNQLLE